MRRVAAVALALTLACSAIPATAQQKPGPDPARGGDRSSVGMRSVTGTVKKTTEKGLVVVGRETGQQDKEWAFVLDANRASRRVGSPRPSFGRVMPSR